MTVAEGLRPFIGVWLQASEPGARVLESPRRRAVHTIAGDPESLLFHERWTWSKLGEADESGETVRQAAFVGPLGEPVTLEQGLVYLTDLSQGELVTEIRSGEGTRRRTTRAVEGEALRVVTQEFIDGVRRSEEGLFQRVRPKQVILYRRDLKMRKGKIAAQCAHASMAVFFRRQRGRADELRVALDGPMSIWSRGAFAKIVLSVETEAELVRAYELAQGLALPCALITDSGRTEFRGVPTRTAVAIGPAAPDEIDLISGPGGAVVTKLA